MTDSSSPAPSPRRPRLEVRQVNPRATRRRLLWMALALVLALAAGAAGGAWWGLRARPAAPVHRVTITASDSAETKAMAQEIATLKRSRQIAKVAASEVRETLADREEEISALRADLAFYSDLVGSGERSKSLAVHGVRLEPVAGSRAWHVTITLTRSARRGRPNTGTLKLAIQGVDGGQLHQLDWDAIAIPDGTPALGYDFKYFQQLHATVALPQNFTPNRLRVLVYPAKGKNITHDVAWPDALKSDEDNHVQQQKPIKH